VAACLIEDVAIGDLETNMDNRSLQWQLHNCLGPGEKWSIYGECKCSLRFSACSQVGHSKMLSICRGTKVITKLELSPLLLRHTFQSCHISFKAHAFKVLKSNILITLLNFFHNKESNL